jgi:hypothetical protein
MVNSFSFCVRQKNVLMSCEKWMLYALWLNVLKYDKKYVIFFNDKYVLFLKLFLLYCIYLIFPLLSLLENDILVSI